jgi:hypothetical protein
MAAQLAASQEGPSSVSKVSKVSVGWLYSMIPRPKGWT